MKLVFICNFKLQNLKNMKKLFYLLLAVMMFGQISFAQNKAEKKEAKKEVKKDAMKPAAKPDEKKAPKMKKDGTPDMRHKENKEAAKKAAPAGPLKKDGTPDMRHKANKEAAKKK